MKAQDFKLCYIRDNFAYFTTQELDKQRGDDWNDTPYEHNAGTPYTDEGYEILKIAFETELEQPCANVGNSSYSVEMINKGIVAWLESPKYEKHPIRIFAGISLEEFINQIEFSGGKVYLPKGYK